MTNSNKISAPGVVPTPLSFFLPPAPMLAHTIIANPTDNSLEFLRNVPILMERKYDGVRAFYSPKHGFVSRAGLRFKNPALLGPDDNLLPAALTAPIWLDGEIVSKFGDLPNIVTSFVNGKKIQQNAPPSNFYFIVFDLVSWPALPAFQRKQQLDKILGNGNYIENLEAITTAFSVCGMAVFQAAPYQFGDIFEFFADTTNSGLHAKMQKNRWEGLMIRPKNSLYLAGRASKTRPSLMRIKPRETFTTTCIGFEEAEANCNPVTYNHAGRAIRSSHKLNKLPKNSLGSLVCRTEGMPEFRIGTGFTQAQRDYIWSIRHKLYGAEVTYTAQECGKKDLPRSPVFVSIDLDNLDFCD